MRQDPSRIEANPQIIADQFLVVILQLVPEEAVDPVDREVFPPMLAPLRAVIPLHGEQQLADRLGKVPEPLVVLTGIVRSTESTA